MFYCQHSLGMGHLVRSMALARGLAERFDVTFLNGGRSPKRFPIPEGIDVRHLPPVGFDKEHKLISCDRRRTLETAMAKRKRMILESYKEIQPDAVVIELFPFGRKKFTGELVPLLEEAKSNSVVICSLRDILVGKRSDQKEFEDRAVEMANRYFDAVFVHSDKRFASLGEALSNHNRLRIKKFYTGFVVPRHALPVRRRGRSKLRRVIVSAGGGLVGEDLFLAALSAHKILVRTTPVKMTIATGLFLDETAFGKLQKLSKGVPDLRIVRFVKDLPREMSRSDVSVSQCGYNTAFDILRSRVSALVVPYSEKGENEQSTRARKLESMGLLRVLDADALGADRLAKEIRSNLEFEPSENPLSIDGANRSAELLLGLTRQKKREAKGGDAWLDPVKRALESNRLPSCVFFRDDDAGFGDDRLWRLLDLFGTRGLPLSIAAIPARLDPKCAERLVRSIRTSDGLLAVHQHGYAHVNHERRGRKYEFGPSRSHSQQFRDIREGKKLMSGLFCGLEDPIFTPPWNRCTSVTARALHELGFSVLSRESRAHRIQSRGLLELPISIDWLTKRKGVRLGKDELSLRMAEVIRTEREFGVMLHHAEMDHGEREAFEQFCMVLGRYGEVNPVSMMKTLLAKPDRSAALAQRSMRIDGGRLL